MGGARACGLVGAPEIRWRRNGPVRLGSLMTAARPRLEKVTPDTVLAACRLEVAPEQRVFVAPVAQSLAEAYVHPDIAWPRLVCDGERVVGFVMAFFDVPFTFDAAVPDAPLRSGLWRLAVASRRAGPGVRAVRRGGGERGDPAAWRDGLDRDLEARRGRTGGVLPRARLPQAGHHRGRRVPR